VGDKWDKGKGHARHWESEDSKKKLDTNKTRFDEGGKRVKSTLKGRLKKKEKSLAQKMGSDRDTSNEPSQRQNVRTP